MPAFPNLAITSTTECHKPLSETELIRIIDEFFSRDFILSCIIDKNILLTLISSFFQREAWFSISPHSSMRMTSIAALFAIFAMLIVIKPLCRCISEWPFEQSINASNAFTGLASLPLVTALFVQHIYAIGNKTTNQAKDFLGTSYNFIRRFGIQFRG